MLKGMTVRHPSELLLLAIKMNDAHVYIWMETLHIFKFIWYGYVNTYTYTYVQMEM